MRLLLPLLTGFLVLSLLAAAPARSDHHAYALDPAKASAGWLKLFDGETTFGWEPRGDARWAASGGEIIAIPGSGRGFLATTSTWENFELHVEFWADDIANGGVFLRTPDQGGIDESNAYEVNIYDRHPQWPTGSINRVARAAAMPRSAFRWNSFDITADGGRLTVWLNGHKQVEASSRSYSRGPIALQYNGLGDLRYRNIRLRPLGLRSIFNGKDLTGWKEIPGRKSVYSVTPEGWLNVKDGNGDIQTVDTWANFILQLDIITKGTHLNSGVFFRGDAGQFWSGYESQIRNQWTGEDRTRPVDFGTGGIYNQQPARRVVSNDREWFTMTVNAFKRRMGVWINGYQVSDFLDRRAPNSNARQGYREAAGVLSLQGHDPTTDISFRRIRVDEMPAER